MLKLTNSSQRIVCIGVRWKRPCAMQFFLKAQAGWAENTHAELSLADKSEDRVLTIEVIG